MIFWRGGGHNSDFFGLFIIEEGRKEFYINITVLHLRYFTLLFLQRTNTKTLLQLHGGDWMSWQRNPPAASHFGGVLERQICSVQSILNSLLAIHRRAWNGKAFRTFSVEAERIVNSKPLTTDTLSDVHSPVPLAPMNLLTMKSKVVAPPPGSFHQTDIFNRRRWRRIQHLLNEFWSRWRKEYLQNYYYYKVMFYEVTTSVKNILLS